jgi:hypothetical protein
MTLAADFWFSSSLAMAASPTIINADPGASHMRFDKTPPAITVVPNSPAAEST